MLLQISNNFMSQHQYTTIEKSPANLEDSLEQAS